MFEGTAPRYICSRFVTRAINIVHDRCWAAIFSVLIRNNLEMIADCYD